MKFLADEDFPKPLVNSIRKLGFSVKTIQQKNLQGVPDEVVAGIALKEKRILLTFDKDFLKKQPRKLQVVIFEFPRIPTVEVAPLVENFLKDLKKLKKSSGQTIKFSKYGLRIMSEKIRN